MAKVVIKETESGRIEAEITRTPVLITELIHDFPSMCEAEIQNALKEIRDSAEKDQDISRIYAKCLKDAKKKEHEEDFDYDAFEAEMCSKGIEAIRACVEDHHDMKTALTIMELCKCIGGDDFHVELTS